MPYLGDLLTFGSGIAIFTSLILYILVWRGKTDLVNLARNFFIAATAMVVGALGVLLYLILTHDFTVAYVFSYSSTDLPFGFLLSSLWGGQEGTFLLWIVFVSIMGLVLMRTSGSFEFGNMVWINLFLLTVIAILIKKSPFELMPVYRTEGAGLNPLLQNFWMQIHPPIMFVGFATAVFPFAFAMTALVERKYDTWAEKARSWTLFAWIALGTSLVMGGYWAYITLGWGGFWAWDPVENSSFIPWIFLTSQVHVLFIKRVRRGLMRFSLFMVSLSFWSVLYGTFLTRSGVLADFSVHSFVDLGINNFLISGLILFVILGLSLIFWRWKDIKPNPSFSKVASRSYLVSLGIVVLFVGGVMTLMGTSAPLLTRFTENPSAVGLNYYFVTMTPVAIAVMLLISIFPAFRWNNGISKPFILLLGGATFIVTVAVMLLTGFTYSVMYLLFFGTAAMAIVCNAYVLVKSFFDSFVPGYLAHIGLALAMVGAGLSAGFEMKKTITLTMNQPVTEMGYTMTFVKSVDTPKGFDCHVEFTSDNDAFMAILPHEFPKNQEGVMRKPYVSKYFSRDIYVAPIAFEPGGNEDASLFEFEKEQSRTIDKYTITFHDFELTSHETGSSTTAAANITVAYDGKEENIQPTIAVLGNDVENTPARFDYNKGSAAIAGIHPEKGTLVLQLLGDFIPMNNANAAKLVIELSEKPWINLFWFGTMLCFLSGGLSMRERRRKRMMAAVDTIEQKKVEKEPAA